MYKKLQFKLMALGCVLIISLLLGVKESDGRAPPTGSPEPFLVGPTIVIDAEVSKVNDTTVLVDGTGSCVQHPREPIWMEDVSLAFDSIQQAEDLLYATFEAEEGSFPSECRSEFGGIPTISNVLKFEIVEDVIHVKFLVKWDVS